jgi:hypothetical protein
VLFSLGRSWGDRHLTNRIFQRGHSRGRCPCTVPRPDRLSDPCLPRYVYSLSLVLSNVSTSHLTSCSGCRMFPCV